MSVLKVNCKALKEEIIRMYINSIYGLAEDLYAGKLLGP